MKKIFRYLGCVTMASISCSTLFAQNANLYHVAKTFKVEGDGKWDYIAQNPVTGNIYIAHGTIVNIIDKNTGAAKGTIANTDGVHGIGFAPKYGKGFTTNGKLNNVTVFDIKTNKVLAQVKTGESPDAIIYDAFSKKMIVCDGHSKSITVINPADNKVTATISVDGKPETAVSDDAGKIYVNLEDKNEISVIDAKTFKVVAHWSLGKGEGPTGLAIDKKTKRLFAGCDKMLVIINMENGSLVDYQPIGDGCDGVAFDAGLQQIYASNGEGTLTVIKENNANDFKVLENTPTVKGARTLVVDETTHQVYLPVADRQPSSGEGKKADLVPGTFRVLVVGN